ncbi:MAG: hypothetical protein EOO02_16385 [Chitinophagaceae bacterium]|nr:MAG: hypothetical protein EOO02_16385 [Chitinophagaceae bacterium]
MKTSLRNFITASLCLLTVNQLAAQSDLIRQQGCDVKPYQISIDSLKQIYSTQGYQIVREASMTMESQYEMPIVVPMNEGTWYQFVFIGDPGSKLYEVRMFDWAERQVVYKKNQWGEVDGNIISYNYVPKATEYHMIKPVQVNKGKKKLCGYVLLLKKTGQGEAIANTAATTSGETVASKL